MNHRKKLSQVTVLLFITLGFATGIVAADYIGPDRVHTETSYEVCEYGVWAHEAGSGETCYDASGAIINQCTDCGWECDPGAACGAATYYYSLGTRVVSHTVTVTDPEATVSSSVSCSVWGDASWCTQPANTVITAHEPMPANQILLIEGTRNGETFACSGTSCTVPMLEGSNGLTYWAISDYGDSSRLGTRTVLQDTQAPQINASLSGTAGQNGWFVSPAELTVIFSDPVLGSGLVATSALVNGTLTDVSHPVTLIEGVYAVVLDVRDAAGLTAQASQTVYVDTTAPALTPQQPQAEVNGYMNGSVIFRGTVSDATSGVRTVLVTVDGVNWDMAMLNTDGTWVLDWNSVGMTDGVYTPRAAAVDNAGNRTEISLQAINLDNSPPGMSMTNAWYIWESGHLRVEDNRSGIQRIQLSVRDDQNRWPAMIWEYEVPVLERDLQWNRRFADGTTAPIGSYEVLLQAWDKLGNESWLTARIYIPAAGATPPIPPQTILTTGGETPTAVPTQQGTQPVAAAVVSPTRMPTAEPAPVTMSFSSVPDEPAGIAANKQDGEMTKNSAVDPNLLWGAAAVSAAAGAAAYAMQKKKEREAARKAAEEAERDAAYAKVAAYEARKVQNYLQKLENDRAKDEKEKQEFVARFGGRKQTTKTEPEDDERNEQMARMQNHYNTAISAYQKRQREKEAIDMKLTRNEKKLEPYIPATRAGLPSWVESIVSLGKDWFIKKPGQMETVIHSGNDQVLKSGATRTNYTITGPLDDLGREAFDLHGTGTNNLDTITGHVLKNNVGDALPNWLIKNSSDVASAGTSGAKSTIKTWTGPILDVGISAIFNGYDTFFVNQDLPAKEKWKRFAVGTGVDMVIDVAVGVAAAVLTGALVAAALAVGVATVPVSLIVGLTIGISLAGGYAINHFGIDQKIKNWALNLF